ncbi:MAG TPA: hypothetical protein VLI54_00735 [Bacillota bacterium]|nr:hypothetical protein [Bacillota bacterium]
MQNDRSFDGIKTSPSANRLGPVFMSPAPQEALSLDGLGGIDSVSPEPAAESAYTSAPTAGARKLSTRWILIILAGLVSLLIIASLIAVIRGRTGNAVKAGQFGTVQLSLDTIKQIPLQVGTAKSLKVNGLLQVTNSILLKPASQPSSPTAGQLYYDKTSNQLSYYNGQQFVGVGAGSAVTNVTNVLGNTAASVRLQTTAPGAQQAGNFNINGIGQVGVLKTTVISSDGAAFYINPTSINTAPTPEGTPIILGQPELSGTPEPLPGWINGLNAQKVTVGETGGKVQSMSVHFIGGSALSHVQFAIYDDDGDVPSRPSARLTASGIASLTPDGWTTISLPAITLSPNTTYWIAVNTDDATVRRYMSGGAQNYCYTFKNFGAMPDPFSSGGACFTGDLTYPLYMTYLTSAGSAGAVSQAHVTVGTDGSTLFRNSEDSSNALQVQNAAGSSTIFNVDTINGRISIGKANASYKLDIAGGDINLSNGHSLRFGGTSALTVTGSGITALSNLNPGGSVRIQGDTFSVQDRTALHANLTIDNSNGATVFTNASDSTDAFQIQNAAGTPLFKADTSGMALHVGDSTGSATPVILYLANKNTAGDPASGAEGGTYYNSTLSSFRCFHTGFWQNCADIEPQHSFSLYDEFIGGQTSFSGNIGSLGWNALAIGANGSLALNPATPTPSADRPGVLRLQTPAVSNQGTTLSLGDASGGSMLTAKDNDVKTAVAVGAITGQVLRVGLHNEQGSTTQPISGVWWEANPAASANWRYCTGNGTAATCTDSSVALAANAWVTLEIRVTSGGAGTSAATFVINNTPFLVTASTIDTTNRVSPALSCYATTGTVQNCYWDYFQLTGTTSTRR